MSGMTDTDARRQVSPRRSTPFVLLLAVALVFGVGGARGNSLDESLYAAMPAPEEFADPGARTAPDGALEAPYELSRATIRFRAGSYSLYRFSQANTLLRQRTVRFSTAVRYRATAEPVRIGNRWFTRIKGGPWMGWHVATAAATPTSLTTFAQPQSVQLPKASHAGLRFYAKGRITTRRVATLSAPETYQASKAATFAGREYLLLASGPLAGRWVAKSAIAVQQIANSDGGSTTSSTQPLVTWKTLVLMYRETDVTFKRADGSNYRLRARMSDFMYDLALKTVRRTVGTVNAWSGKMAALDMKIVDVPNAVTSVAPFGGGYWVGPQNVKPDLDRYAPTGSYDSIVIIFPPKDANGVVLPVPAWGLTVAPGPWANGAGFTSLKTPLENWWWTDATYPEEVFIHEWMHQVLFFHETTGYTNLNLQHEAQYGYTKTNGTWKAWLSDVMQGKVRDGTRLLGINADAWRAGKPTRP
jgi:hypothetical protein